VAWALGWRVARHRSSMHTEMATIDADEPHDAEEMIARERGVGRMCVFVFGMVGVILTWSVLVQP
jgi:hypothetical protein